MVKEITIEHALHNSRMKLFLKFDYDRETIELVKKMADTKWSHTYKSWYMSYYNGAISLIKNNLSPNGITLNMLNEYDDVIRPKPIDSKKPSDALPDLDKVQKEKIKKFNYWLQSKRYSESTIGTYVDAIQTFLRYYETKNLSEITNEDLIIFNNEYIIANNYSASYQNQIVNAVKLFFRSVENKQLQPELIHRPKTPKLLPNVLSKEEIKLILNAHGNIKHKAMLSLIYSCGLRRSELLNLTLNDIDSKRGLVIIRQAKGRKDRIAPLSEKILNLLRDYYIAYKPTKWLFEGQNKSRQYDEASLQKVLKQSLKKAKISKPVTLHWLRHSYATHLLENGTDLRYIQEILGHSSSRTTEIYTHVSNKSLQKIVSPFDTL
jgi:integrase/recombinase XerD